MTEKTQELTKVQKLTKVLKELDGKYQQYKKDRVELLKFVEIVIPPSEEANSQIKADPGKVDSELLLKLFKETEIEKNKIREELEHLRRNKKLMQEKINKIESQTRKQANEEGNALLAKIKSISNLNQSPISNNSSVIESLEEKLRNQEKLISSLKAQTIPNKPFVTPKLEIREVGIQVESASSQKIENCADYKEKMVELQKALEGLQLEYNVR